MDIRGSILYIDDEEVNLKLLAYTFKKNYELIVATSASEGLNILEKRDFDIIISDQRMPEMTGLEFFAIVKDKYPDISRILLTAFIEKETILDSINIGEIFSYVTKPWKKTELEDIIEKGIETTRLRRKNKELIENLRQSNTELENHKKNLEKLVQERTKKLKEINEELQDEIEERIRAEEIIHEQLGEIVKQRDLIAQQQKDIFDDLEYARRIQNALLPSNSRMDRVLHSYFVINLPKSIVSGDFYWTRNINEQVLLAVADCTGHGVSGAFMQMMGYMSLEAIVRECECLNTADILNELRLRIISNLRQSDTIDVVADGMDIALCFLNFGTYSMQYSGAMSPCCIIRNGKLIEIKAEKMPIGFHINAFIPFTYKTIELEPNDMIYLYTDGYSDQFGGPEEKKLKSAVFKKFLTEIAHEPIENQKKLLLDKHKNWKGNNEQTDDILVLGIHVL